MTKAPLLRYNRVKLFWRKFPPFMQNMQRKPHPYQEFIQTVEKPARYLGGEYLSIQKDWETTPVKVAIAFPDIYEIGMSHFGSRILYEKKHPVRLFALILTSFFSQPWAWILFLSFAKSVDSPASSFYGREVSKMAFCPMLYQSTSTIVSGKKCEI